jgi:hypothetical protein
MRSADVAAFLMKEWMPVNPIIARTVTNTALAGGYDDDRAALIDDLRSDVGLFAHVMRTIGQYVDGRTPSVDPIVGLTTLEAPDLRKLLTFSSDTLSKHNLRSGSIAQLRLMETSVVGGGSAELIAEGAGLDKRTGYTATILRNVGANLIAWNYPQAFSKISAQIRTQGIDADAEYERILGVTPQTVSAKLVREWRLSRELEQAVTGEDRRGESSAKLASLSRICEIAEVFGKLNNPDLAEQAKRELDSVGAEVESVLGANGVEKLKSHSAEAQSKFVASLPEGARDQFVDKRTVVVDMSQGSRAFRANTAAQKCPGQLRDSIEGAYKLMLEKGVSQQSLKYLIDNTVKLAGFKRGCVYLWDNEKAELKPALRVGDLDIKNYKPIKYQAGDALSESLFADNPIAQHAGLLHGELVNYCAGSLGIQERVGVLLLVLSNELSVSRYDDPMLYFKAIRGALNEFLKLK